MVEPMARILAAIALVALMNVPAIAQERSEIGQWFDSLKLPAPVGAWSAGDSCCGVADCARRALRDGLVGVEAWIEEAGEWRTIPPQVWITDPEVLEKHPFMQAVVCYVPSTGIVCAVRGRTGG